MEIFNSLLLLWAGIVIIFQVFFIKYLQEQVKSRDELINSYREFFGIYFRKIKRKRIKIIDLIGTEFLLENGEKVAKKVLEIKK